MTETQQIAAQDGDEEPYVVVACHKAYIWEVECGEEYKGIARRVGGDCRYMGEARKKLYSSCAHSLSVRW
jgi:hypothetical protein